MPAMIINGERASIDAEDFAKFHGGSIFTTMRMSSDGEIYLWRRHYQRLQRHCKFFSYEVPHEDALLKIIGDNVGAKKTPRKIRMIIFASDFAITLETLRPTPKIFYRGVSLHTASITTHDTIGKYKSANRIPYQLAYAEALKKNCFEALMLNSSGYVVDGTRTSIIIYDGKKTFTSPQGGIDGVMRAEVEDYLHSLGYQIKRVFIRPHQIRGQILLCNSLMGVVPVGEIKSDVVRNLVEHFLPRDLR